MSDEQDGAVSDTRGDDGGGRAWAPLADRLGQQASADGQPTRWFDELWSAAEGGEVDLPWDRSDAYPPVSREVAALGPGAGRRAVVVGAALGADAEALQRAGWQTTAFDISPAAVRLATSRYPSSRVDYRVADLLELPDDLVGAFQLVVEVFTVQAMSPPVRTEAIAGIRRLLAPGGTAVVVQFVRGDTDPNAGPPWLLDEAEMRSFAAGDVVLTALTTEANPRPTGTTPIWLGVLRRD